MQQVCPEYPLELTDDEKNLRSALITYAFRFNLVTARKGVGLVCADYKGSDAKIAFDSSREDENSAEYDDDNDRNNFKTEKVTLFALNYTFFKIRLKKLYLNNNFLTNLKSFL